ncbi:hypothetical protein [Frankia sp. AiPa1]|uniref:hypothetical protein n=1 Tax=Frankia sp. AiPa1 TaxID=573492 RepID=UPI00202B36CC|nr:hypothetical protein [Frankia sp. AiPa1]MCL9762252.1 hypothetical protein [Frankia sp. AiPa1]
MPAAAAGLRRARVQHIEVDRDWRRCGSEEGGCGVLLPLHQLICPRCGQTNRDDLLPLNIRRLLPTHDAYEHAVAVLRGTSPDPAAAALRGYAAPEQLALPPPS